MNKNKETVKLPAGLIQADLREIQIIKGYNPRHIDVKSQVFLDLVESVRAQGVIVPVHVRSPGPDGPFQLLAGERRYLAAQKADLTTIPAINHGTISDEQAFEITFAENFAREDLTTLEQGRAVGFLLERYKGDYAAVASKLGKAESWVRMRHAIETNLDKEWKALVSPGGRLDRWTAAHLELIARFPAQVQLTILKEVGYWSDLSVKELAQKVADKLRLIRKASFDTAKCIKCAKRSDAQPQLWTDSAAEKVGKGDRCLDAQCWAPKDLAARKQKLQELRDKYPGLVSVCTSSYLWGEEARKAGSTYGKYLVKGYYETCKKTDPKAVPAVIVNGKGAGKITYVKLKHPERDQSGKAQSAKTQTLKDLRAELARNRWRQAISNVCDQIGKIPFEDVMSKNGMRAIIWMAAIYGTGDGTFGEERTEVIKEFEKSGKDNELVPLRYIWDRISESMDCYADSIEGDKDGQTEGRMLASLFELDLEAEYKTVCEDPAFAEPAEWKNLNADGTPKKEKAEDGGQKTEDKKQKAEKEQRTDDGGRKAAKKPKEAKSQKGKGEKVQTCRVCGCRGDKACVIDGVPCHWVEDDLCSGCEDKIEKEQ